MRINFNAPFWRILKGIGYLIGVLSGVALFYMVYILMYFAMEG